MADSNIFQQYLKQPKSVLDFAADYDAADARKQSLQQNALALAAVQQKYDEGQQATQRAAQLRTALQGLPQGATDEQRIQAMRATATPEGFAAADALDKALIERRKGNAAAGKDEGETADKEYKLKIAKHDQALRDMSSFQSPQDALASLQQHVASGELPPEQANMFAQQLQSMSPADFPKWQLGMVQRLVSAKDAMGQIAPDANARLSAETQVANNKANNDRIAAEGAANRANQAKVTQMVTDRQEPGDTAATIDPKRMSFMVDQALRGDSTVYQNLGRGKQGAANLLALRGAVADEAQKRGMTGADLAAVNADYQGQKAGLRTSGNISARVENAAAEADQLAPLAINASRNVARSGLLVFGKGQNFFDTQTNNPDFKRFAVANMGLVTAYAGAMARGGPARVSDIEHAQKLLGTAESQAAYEAGVDQLQQEIAVAKTAPQHVRNNLRGQISGKGSAPEAPAASKPGAKPSLTDIFGH